MASKTLLTSPQVIQTVTTTHNKTNHLDQVEVKLGETRKYAKTTCVPSNMERLLEEIRMVKAESKREVPRVGYNLTTEFITVSESLTNVPEGFPGQQLEILYYVLKNIFSFLPARDLGSAACVCRSWNKVAQDVFKKRNKMSWAVIPLLLPADAPAIEFHSTNFTMDPVGMPLIFVSQPGKLKLPKEFTVTNKVGQTKSWKVKDWLKDCLIRSTKYPYPFIAFPCAFFSGLLSLGNSAAPGPNLYVCCIPKIPNVEIHMYKIGRFNESNLPGTVAKALLVFAVHEDHDLEKAIKHFAPKDTPEKMALCGGFSLANEIVEKERFQDRNASIYISFVETSPESSFTAYSFFVTSTPSVNYLTTLKKHKEKMQLRDNTFVIKVVCTGVRNKAKEYQAFHSVFPDVPCFELYTDVAEIGWNSSWDSQDSSSGAPESKKRKTAFPEFGRQFTCCYMFLTWNNN